MDEGRRPLLDVINEMNNEGGLDDDEREYVFDGLQRALVNEVRLMNEDDHLEVLIQILVQLGMVRDDDDLPESMQYDNSLGLDEDLITRLYRYHVRNREWLQQSFNYFVKWICSLLLVCFIIWMYEVMAQYKTQARTNRSEL